MISEDFPNRVVTMQLCVINNACAEYVFEVTIVAKHTWSAVTQDCLSTLSASRADATQD